MTKIYLFVQKDCPCCVNSLRKLQSVSGWEEVITLVNAVENDELTPFAKDCAVEGTPTLVAFVGDEMVAKVTGYLDMTTEFWEATVAKHSKK